MSSTEQQLREEVDDLREQVDQYRVAIESIQEYMMQNASRQELEQYRVALQSAQQHMDTRTTTAPRAVLMNESDALSFFERVAFTEDDFRKMSKEELVQSMTVHVDNTIRILKEKKRLEQEVEEFQSVRIQLDAKEAEVKQLREQLAALHEQQLRANPPLLPLEPVPVTSADVKRGVETKTTRSANKANKAKLAAELEEQKRFAAADAFKKQQEKRRQALKRAQKNVSNQ